MKRVLILLGIFLLQSCTVTIIYAPKHSCIHGQDNQVEISGSRLKGNHFSQKADGELTTPITP